MYPIIGEVSVLELTNKFDIKVFILYLLKNIGEPLDANTVGEVVLQDAFVNFFDFSICFSDLLDAGQVEELEENGEKLYRISSQGLSVIDEVQGAVFTSIREKALRSAQRVLAFKRSDTRATCEVTPLEEQGYMLTAAITSKDKTLLKVEAYIADEKYANAIKNNFNDKPDVIYKGVLAMISGDVNFIFGE